MARPCFLRLCQPRLVPTLGFPEISMRLVILEPPAARIAGHRLGFCRRMPANRDEPQIRRRRYLSQWWLWACQCVVHAHIQGRSTTLVGERSESNAWLSSPRPRLCPSCPQTARSESDQRECLSSTEGGTIELHGVPNCILRAGLLKAAPHRPCWYSQDSVLKQLPWSGRRPVRHLLTGSCLKQVLDHAAAEPGTLPLEADSQVHRAQPRSAFGTPMCQLVE